MDTVKGTKINKLLQERKPGTVLLSSWLNTQGYSYDLLRRYHKSKWLTPIGRGVMVRTGEKVGYEGAVHALQYQAGMSIHLGGKTALGLLGKAHFVEQSPSSATLFGSTNEKLPRWFKKQSWGLDVQYFQTGFLPEQLGLVETDTQGFPLKVSNAARALMECLYLAPAHQELLECYQLMEGLNNLRPAMVQGLLEKCSSVKVTRLFLYMAQKAGHAWYRHLKVDKLNLGQGKRSFGQGGTYISELEMVIPNELANYA
jgi:hypothetical protein